MKKVLITLLIASSVLGVTGCNNSSNAKVTNDAAIVASGKQEKEEGVLSEKSIKWIDEKYDYVGNFSDGLAWVNKGGKKYETSGEIAGGKFGFIDENGKEVVPLQYQWVRTYSGGLAYVQKEDGKWSVVDKEGKEVINKEIFNQNNNFKIADNDIVDVGNFSEDLASIVVQKTDTGKSDVFYVDKTGKAIISGINYDEKNMSQQQEAGEFREGLATITLSGRFDDKATVVSKVGYIDKSGKLIVPIEYKAASKFYEGLAIVSNKEENGLCYIDNTGKKVIKTNYHTVNTFKEGLAGVLVNSKWGFIDKEGKVSIEPRYDKVGDFNEGLCAVSINGKTGVIDKSGKEVVESKYNRISDFHYGYACVEQGGKFGFIDKSGKIVIPIEHDDANYFNTKTTAIKKGDKWGLIKLK